ncbi:MAG TPA: restriction endonuclease [Micromonosporaceae bacterium]|nr:restriction endonuclease [Micromonosporaceae bacterium]
MTAYGSGTRFERKTRTDLRDNGYEVIRAAGSKGASKVDLVAMKPGELLFVQCKAHGALPPAEWDRLVEVAGWVGALPILAANGPRGRGIDYRRLLGPKRRGQRAQPWQPFLLDRVM